MLKCGKGLRVKIGEAKVMIWVIFDKECVSDYFTE